jgi:hypothetical protein
MKLRENFSIALFLTVSLVTFPLVRAEAGEKLAKPEQSKPARNPAISNLQLPFNASVFVVNGEYSEQVDFPGSTNGTEVSYGESKAH